MNEHKDEDGWEGSREKTGGERALLDAWDVIIIGLPVWRPRIPVPSLSPLAAFTI